MKRTTTILSFLLCAMASHAQKNTVVQATIKGMEPGQWVYCTSLVDREKVDSVATRAGGFTLNLDIPQGEGDAYIIRIGKKYADNTMLLLYMDGGKVNIKGEGPLFKDAKLSGSKAVEDRNAFEAFLAGQPALKGRSELYKKANELYSKKDSVGYAALEPELKRMDSTTNALTKQWVLQHNTAPFSAYVLSFNLGRLDLDEKEAIYNQLSPEAKNNAPAKRIAHSIQVNNLTGIGKVAMDFTQNDTAGSPVSLSSFRGKYVLVDFWASWCVPCRGENPNVVKAFKHYKDKNFTVLGISLDQPNGKDKWLKAIHDDGLTWTQVSDLKFWNNAVAQQYDIRSIPSNILISPEGKILAKDLHGEELEKKLSELLGPVAGAQAGAEAGGDFVLNGHLSGKDGWLYLYYTGKEGQRTMDSVLSKDGQFVLRGSIEAPNEAYLMLKVAGDRKKQEANSARFFISPAVMDLGLAEDDFAHARLTGSPVEDENQVLEDSKKPVEAKYKIQLDSMMAEKDHDKSAAIRERLAPYFAGMREKDYDFFKAHPQSYVTAFNLRFHVGDLSLDALQGYYDRLGSKLQQSASGKDIAKELVKLRAGSPGSPAKDFTAQDINGKPLTLSAFKGKSYVIIDFWASWCVPCRHSNPHLKALFQKYHGKGLEVIGVSDDDGKPDAWKKAVAQDGVGIWHNVLRGLDWDKIHKGEPNEKDISEKFGIHSLPTKILIDKNGTIIGRYGEGREDEASMDTKLAEIFSAS